jgi:hypothetical protein
LFNDLLRQTYTDDGSKFDTRYHKVRNAMSHFLREFTKLDKPPAGPYFAAPINFDSMGHYFPMFHEFAASVKLNGLLDISTIRSRFYDFKYLKINSRNMNHMNLLNITETTFVEGVERMKKDLIKMVTTMIDYYKFVLANASTSPVPISPDDFNTRIAYVEKLHLYITNNYYKVENAARGIKSQPKRIDSRKNNKKKSKEQHPTKKTKEKKKNKEQQEYKKSPKKDEKY